ncbi:MAG: hypothetical protein H7835_17080 [Magnetococcus sp. XQGC-1]
MGTINNYLALGPLIVSRLQEQIQEATVSLSWGVPVLVENPLSPAIVVLLEEDQPAEEICRGMTQKIVQTWLVLVVIRDTDEIAGQMISNVYKALAGWSPDDLFYPLKRVKSPNKPDISPNGVSYFPLSFQTFFVFDIVG